MYQRFAGCYNCLFLFVWLSRFSAIHEHWTSSIQTPCKLVKCPRLTANSWRYMMQTSANYFFIICIPVSNLFRTAGFAMLVRTDSRWECITDQPIYQLKGLGVREDTTISKNFKWLQVYQGKVGGFSTTYPWPTNLDPGTWRRCMQKLQVTPGVSRKGGWVLSQKVQ